MEQVEIELQVNGKAHNVTTSTQQTLLNVLRDELELVGAREGCGIGMCGACTVLIDGHPVSSCLVLAVQAQGREIITVEGLAEGDVLHPVQQAYIDEAGFQCAFCTPGFILTTVALLKERPNPDEAQIREYLAGNLCRCGSYANIVGAVKLAAQRFRADGL